MNIGILRRNGLGDLLCAYPLILYFQKKYPASSITLFVDTRNAPLLPYLPAVNEVVVFPASGNKYWNHFRVAMRYRNQFDLAISAKTSPMKLSNLFLYWLKARERRAYVDKKWTSYLINHPTPYDPIQAEKKHQALKGLNLIEPEMEEVPKEFYPTLSIPESIKEKYKIEFSLPHPIIHVSATINRPTSRFDPKRTASLLNRLHAVSPISVLVTGQKEDASHARAITASLRMPHLVHFPRNFDEFMVLIDRSDLFFVGDGGVAHIGAALGKEQVVLFAETNPIAWHPLSTKAEILYHPVHVDQISDIAIFQALMGKLNRIMNCGRDNM